MAGRPTFEEYIQGLDRLAEAQRAAAPPPPPSLLRRAVLGFATGLGEPIGAAETFVRRLARTAGLEDPGRFLPRPIRTDLPQAETFAERVAEGIGHGLGMLPWFAVPGALTRAAATRLATAGIPRVAEAARISAAAATAAKVARERAIAAAAPAIRAAEFAGELAVPAAVEAVEGRPERIPALAAGLVPIRPVAGAIGRAARDLGPAAQRAAQAVGTGAGFVAGGAAARAVTGEPVIPPARDVAAEFAIGAGLGALFGRGQRQGFVDLREVPAGTRVEVPSLDVAGVVEAPGRQLVRLRLDQGGRMDVLASRQARIVPTAEDLAQRTAETAEVPTPEATEFRRRIQPRIVVPPAPRPPEGPSAVEQVRAIREALEAVPAPGRPAVARRPAPAEAAPGPVEAVPRPVEVPEARPEAPAARPEAPAARMRPVEELAAGTRIIDPRKGPGVLRIIRPAGARMILARSETGVKHLIPRRRLVEVVEEPPAPPGGVERRAPDRPEVGDEVVVTYRPPRARRDRSAFGRLVEVLPQEVGGVVRNEALVEITRGRGVGQRIQVPFDRVRLRGAAAVRTASTLERLPPKERAEVASLSRQAPAEAMDFIRYLDMSGRLEEGRSRFFEEMDRQIERLRIERRDFEATRAEREMREVAMIEAARELGLRDFDVEDAPARAALVRAIRAATPAERMAFAVRLPSPPEGFGRGGMPETDLLSVLSLLWERLGLRSPSQRETLAKMIVDPITGLEIVNAETFRAVAERVGVRGGWSVVSGDVINLGGLNKLSEKISGRRGETDPRSISNRILAERIIGPADEAFRAAGGRLYRVGGDEVLGLVPTERARETIRAASEAVDRSVLEAGLERLRNPKTRKGETPGLALGERTFVPDRFREAMQAANEETSAARRGRRGDSRLFGKPERMELILERVVGILRREEGHAVDGKGGEGVRFRAGHPVGQGPGGPDRPRESLPGERPEGPRGDRGDPGAAGRGRGRLAEEPFRLTPEMIRAAFPRGVKVAVEEVAPGRFKVLAGKISHEWRAATPENIAAFAQRNPREWAESLVAEYGGFGGVVPETVDEVLALPRAEREILARQFLPVAATLIKGRFGEVLVTRDADPAALSEEMFHIATGLALTPVERAKLIGRFGSEEKAFRAYRELRPDSLLEKIRDFFRRIREALFGATEAPTAEEVLRRIRTGEVFRRGPVEGLGLEGAPTAPPGFEPAGRVAFALRPVSEIVGEGEPRARPDFGFPFRGFARFAEGDVDVVVLGWADASPRDIPPASRRLIVESATGRQAVVPAALVFTRAERFGPGLEVPSLYGPALEAERAALRAPRPAPTVERRTVVGAPTAEAQRTLFAVRAPETTLSDRIKAQIVPERPKPAGSLLGRRDWIRSQIFDFIRPIEVFEAAAGGRLPADRSPTVLARAYQALHSKAEVWLDAGAIDWSTLTIRPDVPALKETLAPVIERMPDFEAYLVLRRARELLTSSARHLRAAGEALLRQFGATEDEVAAEIRRLEASDPAFAPAAEGVFRWHDAVIDYLAASGRYSSKTIEAIRTLHREYVPLWRAFAPEEMAEFRARATPGSPVKGIVGSEAPIVSPMRSMIDNLHAILKTADRNEIFAAMADLAAAGGEPARWMRRVGEGPKASARMVGEIREALGDLAAGVSDDDLGAAAMIFRPPRTAVRGEIVVYRGGRAETWRVDPALFQAIEGLDRAILPLWVRLLGLPARVFRLGITLSPEFQLRNIIRDNFQIAIQGRGVPFRSYQQGFFEELGRTRLFHEWAAASGRMFANMAYDAPYLSRRLARGNVNDFVRELRRDFKGVINPRSPREMAAAMARVAADLREPLERLTALSESPTRIGVFRRALERPLEVDIASARPERAVRLRAGLESREASLDYLRRGAAMRAWTSLVAFMNPALQGLDKVARTVVTRRGKVAALGASMIIAEWLLYEHNKRQPEYQNIPDWLKDISWIYVPENGPAVIVPGPFEWKILFGAIPRRIFEWLDTNDPDALQRLRETVFDGAKIGVVPTVAVPWFENWSNWNSFRRRRIVPRALEDVEPGEQATPQTTEIARRLGRALNYPPVKIDNLIYGYTGTLGRSLTPALDGLLRERTLGPAPETPLVDRIVLRAFFRRTRGTRALGGEWIERFYDNFDLARRAARTRKRLIAEGRLTPEWERENAWKIAIWKAHENAARRFSRTRAEMRRVEEDPSLSAAEKRRLLDEMADRMVAEARDLVEAALEVRRTLAEAETTR